MICTGGKRPRPGEVSALVLAAGTGERLGGRPKAFLRSGGATLLELAVAAVRPFATEILVGVPSDSLQRARRLVESPGIMVLAGGATRYQTFQGLLAVASHDFVLVHEAARPLAPPELFAAVLSAARSFGAAAPYLPAAIRDSMALRSGEFLGAPLPRDQVIRTQTPQAFRRDVLLRAADQGAEEEGISASIPALVVRSGQRVRLVPGVPGNLKVTYPEDWTEVRRRLAQGERAARSLKAARH